ncbi:probable histone acetyltransferase HAC-like 3 isoform X1 [Typha latifolia]|uniref:probable histone acetyltransferase HAC-like 3 isoform X1 n=3 Tax=Typha latifolia TaxID=4733 RepID=UPI003C2FEC47
MAEILRGQPVKHLQNQSSMLPPPVQDGEDILRLWDMNPDSSEVRAIIRNNISRYLSREEKFRQLDLDFKEFLVRALDEKLYAVSPSKVHYMDLSTLEARIGTLIHDFGSVSESKDASCHVSQSISSPTSNSSFFDAELSASQRYGPNQHHRVVASFPLASAGRVMHGPESIPGTNITHQVPRSVEFITGHRTSNDIKVMLPAQYIGFSRSHVSHGIGGSGSPGMYQLASSGNADEHNAIIDITRRNPEANCVEVAHSCYVESLPDDDTHLMFGRQESASEMFKIASSALGSSGNSKYMGTFNLNSNMRPRSPTVVSFSGLEKSVELLSESVGLDKISRIGANSHGLEHTHYLQATRPTENFQLCNQSNDSKTMQKNRFLQQQNVIVENRSLYQLQSGDNLIGSAEMDYIVPNEEQLDHLKLQNVTVRPHQLSADESSSVQLSVDDNVLDAVQFGTKTDATQYAEEHKILFLHEHAINCSLLECTVTCCTSMKKILRHIMTCDDSGCKIKCLKTKKLSDHYRHCHEIACVICSPVRVELQKFSYETSNTAVRETVLPTSDKPEYKEHQAKRRKVEHPILAHFNQNKSSQVSAHVLNNTSPSRVVHHAYDKKDSFANSSSQIIEPVVLSTSLVESCANRSVLEVESEVATNVLPVVNCIGLTEVAAQSEHNIQNKAGCVVMEEESKVHPSSAVISLVRGTEMGKPNSKSASLLDTFTPEILREHIRSLKQCTGQKKAKVEQSEGLDHLRDQNTCSLCGMEKLLFETPPRFCASCSKQINPKGVYYVKGADGSDSVSFCGNCYNSSGETMKFALGGVRKVNLEKRWNYGETDAESEWWVQCDKCKAWQHQICALFNGMRKEAQADYTCPNCFLKEIESRERVPLESSKILGANELPRTMLSDHIEQWLFSHLMQDREKRASTLGKNIDEVVAAEGLTVRVVSSIERIFKVKPLLHNVLKEEKYPTEFPYKSKAILLFQKIEGADVCLFAMYVQEYGSKSALPNQRHVYLSYIDSVRYFRPEIKAASGEALRTFVYHEILIGYLDYCKKRGFTSCSLWVCPSIKRDDYILYCHPTTQKMPKSDKLRDWYQTMVNKAIKQNVIAERTNLYDWFFLPTSECKLKVTAARLPYCENDYWPGEAEKLLEEEDEGRKPVNDRVLRAAKRDSVIGNIRDVLLMHKLGDKIRPMKEDLIMVYLQHTCKHCCHPIESGKRWICTSCKNFQLCDQCHIKEENLKQNEKHPVNLKEKHHFQQVEKEDLPETDDGDKTIESEFFDSRTDFLGLCQSKQYQFDTLRRAKHSTMMILYHLHAPCGPDSKPCCYFCHIDINPSQAWQCTTCPEFALCDSCYQRKGEACHSHKLMSTASIADRCVYPNNGNQQNLTLQDGLDVMVHASKCNNCSCTYSFCYKFKVLFRHGILCKTRKTGGCIRCHRMWYMLQVHASGCKDFECRVPRCKDLKEFMIKSRKHLGPR